MTAVDTRDRIIDTAEQLFADKGYAGTSIRGIVAAAGVNLAAIHYHFGSKDELLLAILDRYAVPVNQRRLELLQQVMRSNPTGLQASNQVGGKDIRSVQAPDR